MSKSSHCRCTWPAVFVLSLSWGGSVPNSFGQDLTPPKADHHAHLYSPVTGRILRRAIDRGTKKQDSTLNQGPLIKTASDLIAVLDEAGIRRATALSSAYLFGIAGEDQIPEADEYLNVQKENDWLLQQVKPYPARLIGFCSENPLRGYAVQEIKRCASIGLHGIKLHFNAADVDLRNPKHIERLKAVFSAADAVGFPILVHLRNCKQQSYGADDARKFIEEVAPSAPNVTLQIAHMAGCGGYDSMTDAAMQAFVQAFGSGRLERKNIYFDLSAATWPDRVSGTVRTAEIVSRIRQIGLDHILFATDWPAPGSVGYHKELSQSLGLEPSELQKIFDNTAPYLK